MSVCARHIGFTEAVIQQSFKSTGNRICWLCLVLIGASFGIVPGEIFSSSGDVLLGKGIMCSVAGATLPPSTFAVGARCLSSCYIIRNLGICCVVGAVEIAASATVAAASACLFVTLPRKMGRLLCSVILQNLPMLSFC